MELKIKSLKNLVSRFPLTILCGITFTGFAWYLSRDGLNDFDNSGYIVKLILTASLGIPLFTGITICIENHGKRRSLEILRILGLIFLVLYYFFTPELLELPESESLFIRHALLLISSVIFVFDAPFLFNRNDEFFWLYTKKIGFRLILTTLSAIILFIGLSLGVFSLDRLLDIELGKDIFPKIWFFIVGIFSVFFFLSGVPDDLPQLKKEKAYPTVLKVFSQYVLIPLVLIYFIILYAYLAKILITQNWPDGLVAMPIAIFAVFGLFAHILLDPLSQSQNKQRVSKGIFVYYIFMIPLTFLLFFSFWKRIGEYGITELRYLGIALSFWLLGLSIYFLVSRQKRTVMIPFSLTLITFLIAFGPWSAFAVSETSQIHRLKNILIENGVLENNHIVPVTERQNANIEREAQKEIRSIIDYLVENHGVEKMDDWFQADLKNLNLRSIKEQWNVRKVVLSEIGVDKRGIPSDDIIEEQNVNRYYFRTSLNEAVLPVNDYDYLFQFSLNERNSVTSMKLDTTKNVIASLMLISKSSSMARVSAEMVFALKDGGESIRFDLLDLIKKLREQYPEKKVSYAPQDIPRESLTFTGENDQFKIKIIFDQINVREIYEGSQSKVSFQSVSGMALVKFPVKRQAMFGQ